MSYELVRNLLGSSEGRFFTVTFRKKDGSIRKMNCRIGVKKYLKGGVNRNEGKEYLFTVFDVQAKGYRTINLDTLISATVDGQHWRINSYY